MESLQLKKTTNVGKPGGLFGGGAAQGGQGGGLFGGGGAAGATGAAGGGLFGQPQKPNSANITSLFNQQAGTAPAPAGGGLFGGQPQVQQAQIAGGLFGGAKPAQPAAGGGGLFGGGAPATQPTAGGGLFGGGAQTQQPAAGGGLFGGGATATSGTFGAQPAASMGGGLFGAPAASTGSTMLSGLAPAARGAGLFGGAQPAAAGGGLFGAKLQPAGVAQGVGSAGGLFGGGQVAQAGVIPVAGGLFGQQPASVVGGIMPTGGLVNQYGQTHTQANPYMKTDYLAMIQQQQQMVKSFQSPQFVAERKRQDQMKQLSEINGLFMNYQKNLGEQEDSEINQFTQTFYNAYNDATLVPEQVDWNKHYIPKYFNVQKKEKTRVPQQQVQANVQGQLFGAVAQPQHQLAQPANTQYSMQWVNKQVSVNLNQWLQSYSQNPDANKFYTVQLNSCQELLDRTECITGKLKEKLNDKGEIIVNDQGQKELQSEGVSKEHIIDKLENKLGALNKRMKSRQQEQNESMMSSLEITKVKNQQILAQLIRIYGKFEHLCTVEGRAQVRNAADRDALQNAQNKLLRKIADPDRAKNGLLVKVEDVQTIIRQTEAIDDEIYQAKLSKRDTIGGGEDEETREQEITDDDLQDMFNVLKKQKRGIDILTESINESTRQLMVMEREIELGCGHRRAAAREARREGL